MIRLSDEQWERIRNHFPEEHIPDGRPGRKPIPTRRVLEAVLWILNTGAQWHVLPQSYPNCKTVHRRFQTWCRDEVLRRVQVMYQWPVFLGPLGFTLANLAIDPCQRGHCSSAREGCPSDRKAARLAARHDLAASRSRATDTCVAYSWLAPPPLFGTSRTSQRPWPIGSGSSWRRSPLGSSPSHSPTSWPGSHGSC